MNIDDKLIQTLEPVLDAVVKLENKVARLGVPKTVLDDIESLEHKTRLLAKEQAVNAETTIRMFCDLPAISTIYFSSANTKLFEVTK